MALVYLIAFSIPVIAVIAAAIASPCSSFRLYVKVYRQRRELASLRRHRIL